MSLAELKRFELEIMPLYWHQNFKEEALREMYDNPLINMDIASYMMGTLSKEYDLRPHLAEIKVPALILQGRYDWVTPMLGAEEMARGIPNARLHIFEHSGHVVFMEEPEELLPVRSFSGWFERFSSQPIIEGSGNAQEN